MTNKATKPRPVLPLRPSNPLYLVKGTEVTLLLEGSITKDNVGLKAYGLSSIPAAWTKEFFVVSGHISPTSEALDKALNHIGLSRSDHVMVRSSGTNESMDHRGSLDSSECLAAEINLHIAELKKTISSLDSDLERTVHWIVQPLLRCQAKGHFSNELRLSEKHRDWVAEVEPSPGHPAYTHSIAIREWRDAKKPSLGPLKCAYRQIYSARLEDIGKWALARQIRVHFEWVWDGQSIYIVQADEEFETVSGVDPKSLTCAPIVEIDTKNLNAFQIASETDFSTIKKLSNAKTYRTIGYDIVDFYVLSRQEEIDLIVKRKSCSDKLIGDLNKLTKRPLVIRTDGLNIPACKRQMLPRSDELRTADSAIKWLTGAFRETIKKLELEDREIRLIAHSFVPAAASAWCQAYPNSRRVRIESLWGIPEGIYWHAHDVFDVDSLTTSAPTSFKPSKDLPTRTHKRYKGNFIAPNSDGQWVLHKSAKDFRWKQSIRKKDWINEIAWSTRRIAAEHGEPVVVMWLIDIPEDASAHKVMPWYHETWKHQGNHPKAAPPKNQESANSYTLRTRADWEQLKSFLDQDHRIARVIVDPIEPDIVRDQAFSNSLGNLAKEKEFVVELSGGILSHAYYLLLQAGCEVECADFYAAEDEELQFNKLVRDRIPERILSKGENVEQINLQREALISALKDKLIEEAFEVADAKTNQQVIEELADLREVIDSLISKLDIDEEEIKRSKDNKAISHGKFDKAVMLSRTVLSSTVGNQNRADILPEILPTPRLVEHTIDKVEKMPKYNSVIRQDKRTDIYGNREKLFTMILPVQAKNFVPPRASFTLGSKETGTEQEYILSASLERDGADLRCRIIISDAPMQISLLPPDDE